MKKLISIVAAALCCAGMAWSSEYQEMEEWLWKTYVTGLDEKDNTVEYYRQKDAFGAFMSAVHAKVQQEYPVDPQLTKQIADLKAACEIEKAKKLQQLGANSEEDLRVKLLQKYPDKRDLYNSQEWKSYTLISADLEQTISNLMETYNEEFQKRYEIAFIEAVKKFQENASTMK